MPVERVFVGWDRPLLDLAAGWLANDHPRRGILDLHGSVCVLPGARGMRRLKERLLDEASRRGLRLVPPRTITVGSLPELLYHPSLPLAPPLVGRHAWSFVLRRSDPGVVSRVFTEVPERDDDRGWDLLGGTVLRLQQEASSGGHRFEDVVEVCGTGDLLFDDAARWEALAGAQREYERLLREIGYADRDLARIDALRRGAIECPAGLCLVGLAEMPRIASGMLGLCGDGVRALVHAPAGEAESFDAYGCVHPSAWADRPLAIAPDEVRVVDRPSDQAAAVLDEIAELGEVGIDEVVVGIADDDHVPYLEEWLGAAGLPSHYAGGVPIGRLGPYRLLESTADYLERRDWESFAALVRHPDIEARLVRGRGFPVGAIESLDRYFTEHLPADLSGTPPEGAPGRDIEAVLDAVRDLLKEFGSTRRLDEWPDAILGYLIEVYGGRRLNPHERRGRRVIESLSKIRDAAGAIRRLPAVVAEMCGAPAALRALLDEAGSASIPDEPESAAVELLGWLELALDEAPYVIVTGVNEPALPEAVNADPFLPDHLRTRLGLVDNARRYARDAFHAAALLSSRQRVRFIAGRMSAEGDPLRPSRLLLAAQGEELARRVLSFAESGGSAREAPLVAAAGGASRFGLPPHHRLAVPAFESISVTAFRAYLADPYRFVLERQIGLGAVDDQARELDAGAFGSLAHVVLKRFGHSPEAHSRDPGEVEYRLQQLLEEESTRRFGAASYPAVQLQIEHLRVRLGRFATWQTGRIAEGWRIVLVEGRPAGDFDSAAESVLEAPFEVDGVPVMLHGRIDRVDHHPESGRWSILDYKSGDEPRTAERAHRRGRPPQWIDLQLPLYRHLVAEVRGENGAPLVADRGAVELGFVLLCRDLEAPCFSTGDWGEADLSVADEAARNVIRALRGGEVRFAGFRSTGWPHDPLAPLLGGRQLFPGLPDAEEEAAS
ncbi:MAG: PD-(D/E)XK nuclease family protein [Gemmatimonadota bacterium]